MKITKELEKEMKKLKSIMSYSKIAKKFGVCLSTVEYHLDENYKANQNRRSEIRFDNLTPKQRHKKYLQQKQYGKDYRNNRYETEEYRKNFISMVYESFRRRRKEWVKAGLCSKCGKKREDEEYKQCRGCRKYSMDKHNQKKNAKQ